MEPTPMESNMAAPRWSKTTVIPGLWGVVLGVTVFVALDGPREIWETAASYSWPTVMARIEAVEVNRSSSAPWAEARATKIQYYTHVKYVYQVGTEIYTGTRIHAIKSSSLMSRAHEMKRQFSEGATVPVYYDPNDPSRSVLIPGLNVTTAGVVVIILALGAVATMKLMKAG